MSRDGWQFYRAVFFKVELIDGEKVRGLVMRRRAASGLWEYRRPTTEEESEYRAEGGAWG